MTVTEDHPSPPDTETEAADAWFARPARFSDRRRRPIMVAWLVLALAAAPLALTVIRMLLVPALFGLPHVRFSH